LFLSFFIHFFWLHYVQRCTRQWLVIHVDGVKLCLWTAMTNGPTIHPPDNEYGEPRWNDNDRENQRTRRKPCPSATRSTINPTWTDPGANPGLCGERPATNHLHRRPEFAPAEVHPWFVVDRVALEQVFSPSSSASPVSISPPASHAHIYIYIYIYVYKICGMNNRFVGGCSSER
jgi:hypothetical protein